MNKNHSSLIQNKQLNADPSITIAEADAAIEVYKGYIRQLRHYGGYNPQDVIENADTNQNINDRFNQSSHDVSSKRQPSARDRNNKETNRDLQYIGGLDWGQKPVHPWYGKYPNEPHKVVDYNVTDQGALIAIQHKILLLKEDLLNLDKPKSHKIAVNQIISSIKAQEQLKNKLRRKKK
ncbi:MAG: hypothetical protein EZS28_006320 [Streblomastix strix]|uniref:Uncharacterized protein n=1 Tax=Streblomastix strix TaxID=222440 RepID=A0A5J4WUW9_9EUKA|nr:MAG: hypothetical protein EZS28_006320 [Streblomastix strix]